MEFVVIPVVALLASLLTFFSGFGLGTILLPVFALFFPVDIAVALTAIVHLLNNLFELGWWASMPIKGSCCGSGLSPYRLRCWAPGCYQGWPAWRRWRATASFPGTSKSRPSS